MRRVPRTSSIRQPPPRLPPRVVRPRHLYRGTPRCIDMSERLRDLFARACIAILFTLLSVNLLVNFMRTGRVTGLMLLGSEALVVILTVVRRPAQRVDYSLVAAV